MAATLHDVAALAGVSIKTVSNVVNDYKHIRPDTRDRVLAAIAELGYTPNLTARSLRSGKSNVIGLALPELSLAYFAELADAIIKAADRRGITVLIEQTGGDRAREIALLSSTRRQFTDGLIFSPLGMSNDDAALLSVGYPMVVLGERIFDGPVDHVTMHNVEAAAAATKYLIDRGRKAIAVVGAHQGEVIGSAGLRLRGYREALEAAGVPFNPRLIGYTDLWHRENGATTMRGLMESGVEFDAVFGLNDALALGAMRALQAAGRTVPGDVFVMGFDNLDETQYSLPTLTTIDPGRDQIATSAVDILLQRISEGAARGAATRVETDFAVVERESTTALPSPTRA